MILIIKFKLTSSQFNSQKIAFYGVPYFELVPGDFIICEGFLKGSEADFICFACQDISDVLQGKSTSQNVDVKN